MTSAPTDFFVLDPDEKFTEKKTKVGQISDLYRLDDQVSDAGFENGKNFVSFLDYSDKMLNCSEWLRYRKFEDGSIKLFDARFCRISTCPLCSWRRSLNWRSQLLNIAPKISEDYPHHKYIFLTLTIKNCLLDDLKENIRNLQKGFSNLSKYDFFPFIGGIKSVEVTRQWDWHDSKGTFLASRGLKWYYKQDSVKRKQYSCKPTDYVHPHIHFLGLVPNTYTGKNRVSFREYSQRWKEALRIDYDPIIYVQEVSSKTQDNDDSGLFKAICETLKYTVKDSDLIGHWCKDEALNSIFLKNLTKQLYRCRKIEAFGNFKKYLKNLKTQTENDSLIFTDSEEDQDLYSAEKSVSEVLYLWNKKITNYVGSIVD